jgi:membrane-bound serine protease (ClpP class)
LNRLKVALAAALLAAFALQLAPAHGQTGCAGTGGYYVASLNADIDPGAADFMASTVANAESLCAHTVVFVLNTNGGDGASMEAMIGSIQSYQAWGGTFVTLVAPQYSHAWSAGSYIAEASTEIVMVNGTSIGAATPIVSEIPTGEENGTYAKDIGAFSQYMFTLASANHRNATAAERMVTVPAQTYTETVALELGVVNRVIDTNTVQGALAALGVPADTPINTPGIRPTLISVFSNPNVSSLLFLLGVFAVLADIYHPTVVLSVAGVVVIALALFGLGVFGASPLALFLMIVGAAFIFLEVKTQHGVSAVLGVVVFAVGFLLIYQFPPAAPGSPTNPAPSQGALFSPVPDVTYGLLAALSVAIVIGSIYLRSIREALKKRPKVNEPSSLVGREGVMETDMAAGGRGVAEVASEEWSVTSPEALRRGDAIRVKGVKGNTLEVEKMRS